LGPFVTGFKFHLRSPKRQQKWAKKYIYKLQTLFFDSFLSRGLDDNNWHWVLRSFFSLHKVISNERTSNVSERKTQLSLCCGFSQHLFKKSADEN